MVETQTETWLEKNSDPGELREQVLISAKHNGNKEAEMHVYADLAGAYLELGDFKRAMENFLHCLIIAKQEHARVYEGDVYHMLGLAYLRLGEYKRVITFFYQSLFIAKEMGERATERDVYGSLAVLTFSWRP